MQVEFRVCVDINGREFPFFGDGKISTAGVDGNGSDAIAGCASKVCLFMGVEVKELDHVAGDEEDGAVVDDVEVGASLAFVAEGMVERDEGWGEDVRCWLGYYVVVVVVRWLYGWRLGLLGCWVFSWFYGWFTGFLSLINWF